MNRGGDFRYIRMIVGGDLNRRGRGWNRADPSVREDRDDEPRWRCLEMKRPHLILEPGLQVIDSRRDDGPGPRLEEGQSTPGAGDRGQKTVTRKHQRIGRKR